ncbi:MAG TPA: hypothetical protein VFO96_10070 [Gemmatimonadales bacterium]|jgi:hypothetical protein|nr:hypothetical protein [Gemmatimonadales bacterium]
MEVRRGIDPIRFHLLSEGRHVGTVLTGPDGVLTARFTGFPSSAVAERAGWLARSARTSAELGGARTGDGSWLLPRNEDIALIDTGEEGSTWSITMAVAPVGTPDVFVLAAVRRMWESIRRAGVGRQMVQWSAPLQAAIAGGVS